jgi:hypothetical protein
MVMLYCSHGNSEMRARCNTREINTGTSYMYDKEDVYQEVKECSMNDQYPDDDYEEIHNVGQKTMQ